MPPTVTFWSNKDREFVCTFLDEELRGLSGLGPTPHIAKYELEVAYLALVNYPRGET